MKKSIAWLCAAGAVLAAGMSNAATPIGWWSMDELDANGCVPDLSGNNRPLTLDGDLYLTNFAVSGKALYNPADNRQSCASFSCPANLRERTISMWLRLEQTDGTYDYGDKGTNFYPHIFTGFGGYRVLYSFNDTKRGFTDYLGSKPFSDGTKLFKPRGIWSHLVFAVGDISEENQTATISFYQDGVLVSATNNYSLAGDWSTAKVHSCRVGGDGNNRPIHGFIDEVKVYDVTLTPSEVQEEYWAHADAQGLIAHWTMERTLEEGGKTYVLDENGRNPLLLKGNAAITTDDPVVGNAALLIPGGDGDAAFCSPSNTAQSLTFAAWLWMSDTENVGNPYPRVVDFGTGTFIQAPADTNVYKVAAQYFSGKDSRSAIALADKGRWTHLTVSYETGYDDGGWWQITKWYRNGGLVMTADKIYRDPSSSDLGGIRYAGFNIGGNSSNRPFAGKMDDIWLFNRPLSDEEVRELYCRAAMVSAGSDFSVNAATATLHGQLNPKTAEPFAVSPYGKATWSQVSGPTATIAHPYALDTEVELPANGTYTFRLTVKNSFGDVSTDDVVVTRVAEAGSAPAVSAAVESASVAQPAPAYLSATVTGAERITWSKVSGPGGVYFDDATAAKAQASFTAAGTYVLKCTAENAGASASSTVTVTVTGAETPVVSTTGLTQYWNFDEAPVESLSNTRGTSVGRYWLKDSRVGFGIGDLYLEGDHFAYFNANVKTPCADDLTIAYWMYHDDPVDDTKVGTVMHSRTFYSTQVVIQYENTSAKPAFLVYLYNASTLGGWKFTSAGIDASKFRNGGVKQRWSHVAVVIDASEYKAAAMPSTDRVKFYIDGEALACSKIEIIDTPMEDEQYVIRRPTVSTANVQLGGIGSNNRYFPGVLDEIRYYTRQLSQAEIRRLAFDFAPFNRAPIVEVPTQVETKTRLATTLEAAAYDDGYGTLSNCWKVVSGDASKVSFADPTAANTTVTFAKAGSYVLQLTATDGTRETASPTVPVTVEPYGMIIMVE